MEDSKFLFINHLHDVDKEQGTGLTFFFIRKSIYSTFFGKPSSLPLGELHPRDIRIKERLEQERQDLERLQLEKQKQEERDQGKKAKQQQVRRTQVIKGHQERLQRIKLNKRWGRLGGQAQEQEENERLQNPSLEDERRLEDQQRVGIDEILNIDPATVPQTGEDIHAESSGTLVEEASSNTTVRINFQDL